MAELLNACFWRGKNFHWDMGLYAVCEGVSALRPLGLLRL